MGVAESEFDWREEVMQERVSYTEVGRLGNYAGLSMSSCVREREGGPFKEQTTNRFEFSPLTAQRSRGSVTFSHLQHSSSTVLWRELIPLVTTKM